MVRPDAYPQNSVLLIDEPELHLNPRLIAGLASFYHRHLGRALGNQLWLVTHSDTLIREAVGQKGFSVFHMQPPGYQSGNQATAVHVTKDVDRLVVDLVGDLAAYRPGAKIVIFEGGGESEFDLRMTCTLFPKFASAVNCIAGGNRTRVSQLYELLEQARRAGHIHAKFYAIVDADDADLSTPDSGPPARFRWNVYHIENYLLEPDAIHRVLQDLTLAHGPLGSLEGVSVALLDAARATVPSLIVHKLRTKANRDLVACLNLGCDPSSQDAVTALAEAIKRSATRLAKKVDEELGQAALEIEEQNAKKLAEEQLLNGAWKSHFRGRDVLKRFVQQHLNGLRYENFRDLVIARMRDGEMEPAGMKTVVDAILTDGLPH